MHKELLDAIAFIKEKGFSHIKVELEAYFDRKPDTAEYCKYKCSKGKRRCEECDGLSNKEIDGRVVLNGCSCDKGLIACEHTGRHFNDDGYCHRFILEELAKQNITSRDFNYIQFYRDGSVDSELTFTLPFERMELIPKVIEAFKALGKANDRVFSTQGAGMHTAILPESSGGRYPVRMIWDERKFRVFKTELEKIMPALFFLGSADWRSRKTGFREPVVSTSKYSAIHFGVGAIEYRVFETCYDHPERIYEFVEVIARTLEYWHDGRGPKIPDNIKPVQLVNTNSGYNLRRLFEDEATLRNLVRTIDYLRPKSKTFAQLKAERSFKLDDRSIVKIRAKRESLINRHAELFKASVRKQAKINGYSMSEIYSSSINAYRFSKKVFEERVTH